MRRRTEGMARPAVRLPLTKPTLKPAPALAFSGAGSGVWPCVPTSPVPMVARPDRRTPVAPSARQLHTAATTSAVPATALLFRSRKPICLRAIGDHRASASARKASYSITSSARARIDCGTVSPSASAVLRLTTSSNRVGWTTTPRYSPVATPTSSAWRSAFQRGVLVELRLGNGPPHAILRGGVVGRKTRASGRAGSVTNWKSVQPPRRRGNRMRRREFMLVAGGAVMTPHVETHRSQMGRSGSRRWRTRRRTRTQRTRFETIAKRKLSRRDLTETATWRSRGATSARAPPYNLR